MKTILAALLMLAACTKQPVSKKTNLPPQNVVEIEAATINLDMVNNQMTGALETNDSLNWGNIYQGQPVVKRIVISAKNDIPALDISGFRNAQIFTFKSSNCGTSLQKLRACVIDTEFTPGALGALSEVIALSSEVSFALSANVVPAPIEPVVYNLELSTPLIRIASSTTPVTKIVYVLNKDSQNLVFNSESINFNGNNVLRNSCAGISLKPLRQCWFELSFTASEINSGRMSAVNVFDKMVTIDLGAHSPGSNLITGTFMDGAVSGVSYSTPSYTGTTDAAGSYTCNANETITFKIGSQNIASLPCASVVSPIELATNGSKKYNQSFNSLSASEQDKATNFAVLLQTLDSDGDTSNGITIPPAVANKVAEALSASSSSVSSLVSSASFAMELSQIINGVNTELNTSLSIVSNAEALSHFDDTRLNQAVACAPADVPDSITVTGVKPNCSATSCIAGYEILAGKCEPTAEGITISPDPVNLGNFTTSKLKKTITISNNSKVAKAVKINTSSFNTPGYSLVVTRACPAKLTPNISYCSVEFSYYSLDELTADQALSETFIVNNSKSLAVNVVHKASSKIESPNFAWQNPPANLGTITGTSLTKKFTVKNSGTSNLSGLSLTPASLPAGVTMTKTCGTNLYIGSTCTVDLTFNPNILPAGPFNMALSYSNATVAARLNIAATIVGQTTPCSLTDAQTNGWNTNQYASIGGDKVGTDVSACVVATCSGAYTVSAGDKKCVASTLSCSIDHGVGSQIWNGAGYTACAPASCDLNYVISGNACVPGSCSVSDVNFSSAVSGDKVAGCYATLCNTNYTLNSGACSPTICTTSDINNSAVVSGDKVIGCTAISCNTNYQTTGSSCVPQGCSTANVANSLSVAGDLVAGCFATSCADKYEVNAGSCSPVQCNTTNANIANAQSVSGNLVDGCSVVACNPEYTQAGNTCQGTACTLANSSGNGLSSILNVKTVSGTINNDSCLVASCNDFYKQSSDNKLCDAKLCPELTATELSTLGYNTTGATLSGTYPSCSLSCNSSFQTLAADSKSCIDKTPSGSIAFTGDNTKFLSNEVTIQATNAQQIQLYSDASCSTASGAPLNLPLSSTTVILPAGDGQKYVSAKLINGSLSTNCLSDSIILDQTAPSLAVTAPANNANFEGNSLTVSGTCSDNYTASSSLSVSVTLDSMSQNASCQANGTFTTTFNTESLAAGIYNLSANTQDSLGNSKNIQISVTKIVNQFVDEIEQPAYDKLYFFAQENVNNNRGVELMSLDSSFSATFEQDLVQAGHGYIQNNPGSPSMKKLEDGSVYVFRSILASSPLSSSFVTRNSSGLLINPGQTFVSDVNETGFSPASLYYSVTTGKYIYYNTNEASIKMTPSATDLSLASTISVASGGFNAIQFNNKTYFSVYDNTGANAVYYVKALNPNGTVQVVASTTASTLFPATPFIVFKNKLYMVANIGGSGYKIFLVNEGTGTFDLVTHNTSLISAYSQVNYTSGFPVVVTNGANSVMVFSCNVTPTSPASQTAQSELCIYDGVNPFGVINIFTTATSSSSNPTNLYSYAGKAVFRATVNTVASTQGGIEMVVYDPGAYTDLYNFNKIYIKDLTAGTTASSSPGGFEQYTVNGNNRLVFNANNGTTSTFYTWDGLLPIAVTDLNVPNASSYSALTQTYNATYTIANNYLYYTYTISGSDYEVAMCNLAACNVTTNGRFYDIFVGTTGSTATSYLNRQFIQKGNYVYFQGGYEANGTTWPTKVLRFNSTTPLSYPEVAGEFNSSLGINAGGWVTYLNGDLIMMGNDINKINFQGAFRFDDIFRYSLQDQQLTSFGLTNGIQSSVLTANTVAANLTTNSTEGITYNNKVYMNGNMNDGKGQELLVSDGVNPPVNQDLNPGSGAGMVGAPNFTILNLKNPTSGATRTVLLFWGNDGAGNGLFMIDGNSSPMKLATLTSAVKFTSFKGKIYFVGQDSATGYELWETNGTAAGTKMVADKNPGTGSFLNNTMALQKVTFATGGYQLCMQGYTSATGYEINCYDGETWYSTELLAGTNSGASSGSIMFVFKNKLLFSGMNALTVAASGTYSFDGVSYTKVSNGAYPGSTSSPIYNALAIFDDKAYFSCGLTSTPGNYVDIELCVYDGTNVTFLNLNTGSTLDGNSWTIPTGSSAANFIKYNGKLIFTATGTGETSGMLKIIDPADNTNQVTNLLTTDGKTLSNPYLFSYPLRYIYETN